LAGCPPAAPCTRVSEARTAPGPTPRSRRGRPGQMDGAPCDAMWGAAAVAAGEPHHPGFSRKTSEPGIYTMYTTCLPIINIISICLSSAFFHFFTALFLSEKTISKNSDVIRKTSTECFKSRNFNNLKYILINPVADYTLQSSTFQKTRENIAPGEGVLYRTDLNDLTLLAVFSGTADINIVPEQQNNMMKVMIGKDC
jgi:hypothetical protein